MESFGCMAILHLLDTIKQQILLWKQGVIFRPRLAINCILKIPGPQPKMLTLYLGTNGNAGAITEQRTVLSEQGSPSIFFLRAIKRSSKADAQSSTDHFREQVSVSAVTLVTPCSRPTVPTPSPGPSLLSLRHHGLSPSP